MMDKLSFTILIFTLILLSFVFSYSMYYIPTGRELRRIERKTIFLDWRFWTPALVYSFVLGFRYNYGYDWGQYFNTFNYIQRGVLYRESTEIGYLAINRLLGLIGGNFYTLLILEGFVYILGVCFILKENRRIWLFAIPIVYMINKFNCLNISRQYFAMSVLLIAYRFFFDNKKILFILFSALSVSIHTMTGLFIIPLMLSKKLKYPPFELCIIIYLFCWLFQYVFYNSMLNLASWVQENILTNKQYDMMTITEDRFLRGEMSLKNVLYSAVKGCTYIYGCYLFKGQQYLGRLKRIDIIQTILLVGMFAQYFTVMAGTHEILSRFFYATDLITHIGWGIILYLTLRNYKIIPFAYILAVIFFLIHTIWVFYFNTIGEIALGNVIQYKFAVI